MEKIIELKMEEIESWKSIIYHGMKQNVINTTFVLYVGYREYIIRITDKYNMAVVSSDETIYLPYYFDRDVVTNECIAYMILHEVGHSILPRIMPIHNNTFTVGIIKFIKNLKKNRSDKLLNKGSVPFDEIFADMYALDIMSEYTELNMNGSTLRNLLTQALSSHPDRNIVNRVIDARVNGMLRWC